MEEGAAEGAAAAQEELMEEDDVEDADEEDQQETGAAQAAGMARAESAPLQLQLGVCIACAQAPMADLKGCEYVFQTAFEEGAYGIYLKPKGFTGG